MHTEMSPQKRVRLQTAKKRVLPQEFRAARIVEAHKEGRSWTIELILRTGEHWVAHITRGRLQDLQPTT